jgi:hypothetical protein
MRDFVEWVKSLFSGQVPEEPKDFILSKMEPDGYSYDTDNDWWVRTWTTNQGKESIREIYQKLESGKWNKLMIGYGDRVFYEETVESY